MSCDYSDGTPLGDQELYGKVREDAEGALWTSDTIFMYPQSDPPKPPQMSIVRVGWDPAVTSKKTSDEHGIVTAGISTEGDLIILDDSSLITTPEQAALICYQKALEFGAPQVIIEDTQGKDTWKTVWRIATNNDPSVMLKLQNARGSKEERALPLAMHYHKAAHAAGGGAAADGNGFRRVYHMPGTETLIDEMTTWVPALTGTAKHPSPNRIDALVWATYGLGFGQQRHSAVRAATTPNRKGSFLKAIS